MTMDAHLTLETVFDAYFDCRRTKRNSINQLRFEADLESNVMHHVPPRSHTTRELRRLLACGKYRRMRIAVLALP